MEPQQPWESDIPPHPEILSASQPPISEPSQDDDDFGLEEEDLGELISTGISQLTWQN